MNRKNASKQANEDHMSNHTFSQRGFNASRIVSAEFRARKGSFSEARSRLWQYVPINGEISMLATVATTSSRPGEKEKKDAYKRNASVKKSSKTQEIARMCLAKGYKANKGCSLTQTDCSN